MNTLAFTLGEHRAQLTLKISTYPNGNLASNFMKGSQHPDFLGNPYHQLNRNPPRPLRFHQYKSRRRTFSGLAVRQSPCGTYRANS